jgi:hypothetical protein
MMPTFADFVKPSHLFITPRATDSTMKKREKGEKLILIVREFWKVARQNYNLASVNINHLLSKM